MCNAQSVLPQLVAKVCKLLSGSSFPCLVLGILGKLVCQCFCSLLHQTHFIYSDIHSKTSSESNILLIITISSLSFSLLRSRSSRKKSEMEIALRFADLGPKGTGLFATKNLSRGTRIIAETPDFTFPKTMTRAAIWFTLTRASTLGNDAYFKQHKKADNVVDKTDDDVVDKADDRVVDKTPQQLAAAIMFPAKDESNKGLWATFHTMRMINHACLPNAEYSWNHTLRKGTIHVVCDIEEGDEITINYGFEKFHCRSDHIRKQYGFTCLCDTCIGETSSRPDSDSGFHLRLKDEEVAILNEDFLIENPAACIKYHPETCLRRLYWRYQFFQNRGYQGSGLSRVLLEAFRIVVAHSDLARAKHFARRYLEVQIACHGNDAEDIEKWKKLFDNRRKYIHNKSRPTTKWLSSIDGIPKDPDLEVWMWSNKADGELWS